MNYMNEGIKIYFRMCYALAFMLRVYYYYYQINKIIKEQIYSIENPEIMLESLRTVSLNFTYTSFERLIKKAFNLRLV